MRNLLLLIFILVHSLFLGQSPDDDVFHKVWNDSTLLTPIQLFNAENLGVENNSYHEENEKFFRAKQQYEEAREKKDKEKMNLNLQKMGRICAKKCDYASTVKYYFEALDIQEELGNPIVKGELMYRIGSVFARIGSHDKAIKYCNGALEIGRQYKDSTIILSALINLGGVYSLEERPEALTMLNEALVYAEGLGEKRLSAKVLNNIGCVYSVKKQYDSALEYFYKCLKVCEEVHDTTVITRVHANISGEYIELEDYEKAEYHCVEAFNYAYAIKSFENLDQCLELVYQIYKAQGKYEMALVMQEEFIVLNDSLNGVKKRDDLLNEAFRFETEKMILTDSLTNLRKQEIGRMQRQYDQQQSKFIYLFLAMLLLLLGYILLTILRKFKKERENLLKEIKLLQLEPSILDLGSHEETLDRGKIQGSIDAVLNDTDWNVIRALYNNPTISNQELASEISLSVGGARSSLSKMYQLFDVKTGRNQRMLLIMKAINLSKE